MISLFGSSSDQEGLHAKTNTKNQKFGSFLGFEISEMIAMNKHNFFTVFTLNDKISSFETFFHLNNEDQ